MSQMIYKSELMTMMILEDFTAPRTTVYEFVENELEAHEAAPIRHGHWISQFDKYGYCGEECSRCHEILPASAEYDIEANYCPNCGAKMDEQREDG